MTYLSTDRRSKRGGSSRFWRLLGIAIFILLLIFILIFPHFFSSVVQSAGKPFWQIKNSIGGSSFFSGFASKEKLAAENENLKLQIAKLQGEQLLIQSLVNENVNLKEILSRSSPSDTLILGNVLTRPPESPYDTFIIDVGANGGVRVGETVMALGNIAVGTISDIQSNTATVKLFSSSGEKHQIIIEGGTSTLPAVATGEGGGNFSITLPVGSFVEVGNPVLLPDGKLTLLGNVESIDTPPNAAFMTVLFKTPVNVRNLPYLEVRNE